MIKNDPSRQTPDRKSGSRKRVVLLSVFGGLIALGVLGQVTQPQASVDQAGFVREVGSEKKPVTQSPQKIVTKTETVSETVPFEAVTEHDASQYEGTSYVRQQGVEGIRERTYEITYVDGVEKSRLDAEVSTTREPVHQVTVYGTKKKAPTNCSNGTYVNSDGNTVCRPAQSSSGAPSGATAQCRDGSYSYSQSRRGTCSRHGGVSSWL